MPPRQICERDFTDIRDNWVDVSNTGVVTNFTVVRYDDKHLPRKAPFVLALVKLDGADTPFMHILEECTNRGREDRHEGRSGIRQRNDEHHSRY